MNVDLCTLCDIRYPVILGPMLDVSKHQLVAAFSEAGGLGCLASANMDETQFREELKLIRAATNKPFAVNLAWAAGDVTKIAEICIEEKVNIIVSSAGCPKEPLLRLKEAGMIVLQVVANVSMAKRAESLGLDAVITKGGESGGLNAFDSIGSMTLIPEVVDALSIPVIASGGIGDGRGLAAAIALGAEGVLMGTRFIACSESSVHDCYKQAIVDSTSTDTMTVKFANYGARVLKGKRAGELEGHPSPFNEAGDPTQAYNPERHIYGGGQVAGLVKKVAPVQEILDEIMAEYELTSIRLMIKPLCI